MEQTLLQPGDLILVCGNPRFNCLCTGATYQVLGIIDHLGIPSYEFTRPRGRKRLVIHYASAIDRCIRLAGYNRIEKL